MDPDTVCYTISEGTVFNAKDDFDPALIPRARGRPRKMATTATTTPPEGQESLVSHSPSAPDDDPPQQHWKSLTLPDHPMSEKEHEQLVCLLTGVGIGLGMGVLGSFLIYRLFLK